MNYLKWSSALGLLFGSIVTAQAQTNYRLGYVVLPAGDTIHGELQARGALRSSQQCRFRPAPTAPAVDYTPLTLRAYGFDDGTRYEAWETPPANDHRFLEVLVAGAATLYARRDGRDDTHYYLRVVPTGVLTELEDKPAPAVPSATALAPPMFRKSMAAAFSACFSVQPLLSTLRFDPQSLADVVRRYNGCLGGTAVSAPKDKTPKPRRWTIGFVGGASYSRLSFKDATRSYGHFTGVVPTAGVFLAFPLSALNARLRVRTELLYEHLKYTDAFVPLYVSTVEVHENVTTDLQCLRVPLSLQYYFTDSGLQPFVGLGLSGGYRVAGEFEERSEYLAGGIPVVSYQRNTAAGGLGSLSVGVLPKLG